MANEQVNIDINLIVKQAVSELQKLNKTATKELGLIEKNVNNINKAFASFAGNLAAGAVFSAFNSLKSSLSGAATSFLDLSGAMAEINSILPKNTKLTEQNARKFIEFSTIYGGTAASQAKAFYNIVSAGTTDLVAATNLLSVANKASVAGLTDVNTAINGLTTVMANYGSDTFDATKASDILFATVREGKTTFGELSATIGRAAPLAKAAGVSFEDLSGTVAFLTQTLPSTAEAITGIRGLLRTLINPAKDSADAAKSFGINLTTIIKESGGFGNALDVIIKKTGGTTDNLRKIFKESESLNSILAIAQGNFSRFKNILVSTNSAAGSTAEAFKIIQGSAQFQFGQLERTLSNLPLAFLAAADPEFAELFKNIRISIVSMIPALALAVKAVAKLGIGFNELGILFDKITDKNFVNRATLQGLEEDLVSARKRLDELTASDPRLANVAEASADVYSLEKNIESLKKKIGEPAKSPTIFEAGLSAARALDAATSKLITVTPEGLEAGLKAAEVYKKKLDELAAQAPAPTTGGVSAEDQAIIEQERLIQAEASKQEILGESRAEILKAEIAFRQSLIGTQSEFSQSTLTNQKKLSKAEVELAKITADEKEKQRRIDLQNQQIFLSTAATLSNSSNKTLAAIGKAAAITQIAIKTPPAVASSFEFGTKLGGPPLGFVFAGIAATAMAAQAANIAGVALASGITSVPRGFPDDSFQARLTSGERVVNVEQNKDLTAFLKGQEADRNDETNKLLESLNGLMVSLIETTQDKESTTVVNIGNREIVREVRNGLRAGRSLAV